MINNPTHKLSLRANHGCWLYGSGSLSIVNKPWENHSILVYPVLETQSSVLMPPQVLKHPWHDWISPQIFSEEISLSSQLCLRQNQLNENGLFGAVVMPPVKILLFSMWRIVPVLWGLFLLYKSSIPSILGSEKKLLAATHPFSRESSPSRDCHLSSKWGYFVEQSIIDYWLLFFIILWHQSCLIQTVNSTTIGDLNPCCVPLCVRNSEISHNMLVALGGFLNKLIYIPWAEEHGYMGVGSWTPPKPCMLPANSHLTLQIMIHHLLNSEPHLGPFSPQHLHFHNVQL